VGKPLLGFPLAPAAEFRDEAADIRPKVAERPLHGQLVEAGEHQVLSDDANQCDGAETRKQQTEDEFAAEGMHHM